MHAANPILILSIAAALAAAAPAGAQTPRPGAATRVPPAAPGSSAPSTGDPTGTTVNPVTVQPETTPQGRVVSSTDATSITSPNYSADDAQSRPRAISLGGNAAAGVQTVDPVPTPGVPASQEGNPRHADIGVTTVF